MKVLIAVLSLFAINATIYVGGPDTRFSKVSESLARHAKLSAVDVTGLDDDLKAQHEARLDEVAGAAQGQTVLADDSTIRRVVTAILAGKDLTAVYPSAAANQFCGGTWKKAEAGARAICQSKLNRTVKSVVLTKNGFQVTFAPEKVWVRVVCE